MCDLMWSDPEGKLSVYNIDIEEWEINPRGAGVIFGSKLVDKFLRQNGNDFIVRAHQLVMEGYKEHFDRKLITIWSASNYCYRCKNEGAIMILDGSLNIEYKRFYVKDLINKPEDKPLPEYFL
jgi:serine/threonine-protein phosphatase 4 catalytic subunit